MTRVLLRVAGLAVVLTGALSASAAVSAPVEPIIKNTKGNIATIAMDGALLAYDVKPDVGGRFDDCNKLFVWNVQTGFGAVMSGEATCSADSSSTGGGVVQIAVAGKRVAWIVNGGGNTESVDNLYTSSLPKPKEKHLASALRTGNVDVRLNGGVIGGVVGDGDLLAVNTWRSVNDRISQAKLRLVGASGLKTIATGTGTIVAAAADLNRVAVVRSPTSVALYAGGGRLLRTIAPSPLREVALRKDYLLVLSKEKTIEIYNANTGRRVRTLPVAAGARFLDLHSGIAVYATGRRLHALRLADGKDVVLTTARSEIVAATIEGAGAAYAFNRYTGGHEVGSLGFFSLAKVNRALG